MVLAAIVDITDRKQKEEELRRGQERFQRVVEWVPNAIVMVNRRGQIEMINLQAERIFGYSRAELLGQSIEILVPERFRRQHVGFRTLFFAGPDEARPMGAGRDLYGVRKDGSEFPVEIGLNPIEVDDRAMVLASIVDITDRKHKEDQIQTALKEKDALIREIHHRVKNNLQIVDSMLHLHSAKIDDEVVLDAVRDCQSQIQSMALIHQMLYQSNDFTKVDFARFLDSLVPALITSHGVDSNRIALSIDAAPLFLSMDAAIPCGQVANELLTNAFRHAFPQGRRGNIAVDLTKDAEGRWFSGRHRCRAPCNAGVAAGWPPDRPARSGQLRLASSCNFPAKDVKFGLRLSELTCCRRTNEALKEMMAGCTRRCLGEASIEQN